MRGDSGLAISKMVPVKTSEFGDKFQPFRKNDLLKMNVHVRNRSKYTTPAPSMVLDSGLYSKCQLPQVILHKRIHRFSPVLHDETRM
jgi:hypothetical protein